MPHDRVAFLDIDGVCLVSDLDTFAPTALAALAALKADGWRLILHSTWRHDRLAQAEAMFAAAGIPLDGCVDYEEPSKAKAISMWLDDNYGETWPEVLVVDDDEIDLRGVTLIRCDFREGLRMADVAGWAMVSEQSTPGPAIVWREQYPNAYPDEYRLMQVCAWRAAEWFSYRSLSFYCVPKRQRRVSGC